MKHELPSSRNLACRANYDQAKNNPLQFLHPWEIQAAELFVMCEKDPLTLPTMPPQHVGRPKKWGVLMSGTFGTRFCEAAGFNLHTKHRKNLEGNPAWRHYVQQLKEETKNVVLQKLKTDALEAYDTYKWSREAAKGAGDYKEARLAAGDHLDRIGATEKPREQSQNVVVILRGRNYDETTILNEPEEAEVLSVEVVPRLESGDPTDS